MVVVVTVAESEAVAMLRRPTDSVPISVSNPRSPAQTSRFWSDKKQISLRLEGLPQGCEERAAFVDQRRTQTRYEVEG